MTDFRALCVELTDCLEKADWPNRYKQVFQFWVDIARAALAEEPAEPIPPAALPEGYIDPEHSGDDRALLQTFYSACLAEGGTADEITLRGLRAVLADEPAVPDGREPASVVGEPSDGEIMELMPQQMHEDLADAVRAMAEREGINSTAAKGVMRIMLNRHVVDLARAVLARWGNRQGSLDSSAPQPPAEGEVAELAAKLRRLAPHNPLGTADPTITRAADLLQHLSPPQPPAEGEVAELVAWLREQADHELGSTFDADYFSEDPAARNLNRAAELLQRLSPPQPVPVSERLQQMEDLAADAVAGLRYIEQSHGRLYGVGWDRVYQKADRLKPAHALPVPGQEVEG